ARSMFIYMLGRMTVDEQAVTCPTLVLHGERDQLIPLRAARAMQRRMPAFELVELPGLGHAPQLEAPSVFLDAVVPWLLRLPARSPSADPRRRRPSGLWPAGTR